MTKSLLSLFVLVMFAGCINLREPYPKIEYYNLRQVSSAPKDYPKLEQTVMLRRMLVNESIDSPHILMTTQGTNIRRLFYHRWISDLSTLGTDFIVTRLNQSGLFKNGIIRSASVTNPDYIIEPQLIEMITNETINDNPDENFVSIELKVDLVKRMDNSKFEIVMSKSYKKQLKRESKELKYIANSYSMIFSDAIDNLISDLAENIK